MGTRHTRTAKKWNNIQILVHNGLSHPSQVEITQVVRSWGVSGYGPAVQVTVQVTTKTR